jgi:hypothetical protein
VPFGRPRENDVVFENEHYTIKLAHGAKVVRLERTNVPFLSSDVCVQSHDTVLQKLDMLVRGAYVLLVDLRLAPPRNDLAFEEAVAQKRRALLVGFQRAAILVRTASGRMQVTRHMRDDGLEVGVFNNEREALRYLDGD